MDPSQSHKEKSTDINPLTREVETLSHVPAAKGESTTDQSVSQVMGSQGVKVPTIPGYEIVEELGRGGMGVVYKARQVGLGRVVALKMILSGGYAGASERARFRQEAEAIARLQHQHIVQIYEVGEHEGMLYFSLEYCPGGNLAGLLAGNPQPPREAAALVEKLARGMQVAHQNGIIHRDLKPANVLISFSGEPEATGRPVASGLKFTHNI